jgi:thiol peroxidase
LSKALHDDEDENANATRRIITNRGAPFNIVGELPSVASPIPDFTLWQYVNGEGRKIDRNDMFPNSRPILFCCVHTVEGPVSKAQVRKFERLIAEFENSVACVLVSSDLPFTLNRFAAIETLSCLEPASDYRGGFARAMGVALEGFGILARSVFLADRDGRLVYREIVNDFASEPDYNLALENIDRIL